MRLICPNCGAQYEVPEDVIPAAGRDVQCSNCGHTWLETPGASVEAEGEMPSPNVPQTDPDRENLAPKAEPAAQPAPVKPAGVAAAEHRHQFQDPDEDEPESRPIAPPPVEAYDDDDLEDEDQDEVDNTAANIAAVAARRTLDPALADLLREEAALEEAQRRAEASTDLQSQPDLGVDQVGDADEQREEEARRRMARLKGENALKPAAQSSGARSELLPDIEEINSTLRSSAERDDMDTDSAAVVSSRGRGFRTGFIGVMALSLIATLIYAYAPQISEMFPQSGPIMQNYVTWVDGLRLGLDAQLQDLLARMTSES